MNQDKKTLDYRQENPQSQDNQENIAQLTRHLTARLLEYHCVTLTQQHPEQGVLEAEFAGFSGETLRTSLENLGNILVDLGNTPHSLCFSLRDCHRFEDLDFVWGQLFAILIQGDR